MPIHKQIGLLYPAMQQQVYDFLRELKRQAIEVTVVETLRDLEVQIAYYAQGRKPLEETNRLRQKAKLYQLSFNENLKVITKCDGINSPSNHQARADGYGYAIDIAPLTKTGTGTAIWWNAPEQVWTEIGIIGESCGLDWCAGGRGAIWGKGWDNPHYEYTNRLL